VAVLVQGAALLMQARQAVRHATARRHAAARRAAAAGLAHRRAAEELRERVLQDLSGVGYAMGAVPGDAAAAQRLAGVVQDSLRTLRQLLLDVAPPELTRGTLGPALDDLTAPLRLAGTVCLVRVAADLPVSPAGADLLYRAAREALRGAERAGPVGRLEVTAAVDATVVALTVTVDAELAAPDDLGRDLLADALTDAGGSLSWRDHPGGGRTVVATVPGAESSGDVDALPRAAGT
jgi:signal transduction histidine kinase